MCLAVDRVVVLIVVVLIEFVVLAVVELFAEGLELVLEVN